MFKATLMFTAKPLIQDDCSGLPLVLGMFHSNNKSCTRIAQKYQLQPTTCLYSGILRAFPLWHSDDKNSRIIWIAGVVARKKCFKERLGRLGGTATSRRLLGRGQNVLPVCNSIRNDLRGVGRSVASRSQRKL